MNFSLLFRAEQSARSFQPYMLENPEVHGVKTRRKTVIFTVSAHRRRYTAREAWDVSFAERITGGAKDNNLSYNLDTDREGALILPKPFATRIRGSVLDEKANS